MTRRALGRGLSALIGDETSHYQDLAEIDIDLIRPNPHQPRQVFEDSKLAELAKSIGSTGLLQPIVVRRVQDRFELVAGERRWRAARLAGLERIPAVIKDFAEERLLESSLVENIQREDLNPIEQAKAYQSLVENQGITQDELAERIGRDRSSVTNYLRLLRLPEAVQTLVEEGQISMGHARAILGIADISTQTTLAREIVRRGLSVRDVERMVTQLRKTVPVASSAVSRERIPSDANTRAAEERLRRRFSTIVRIVHRTRGGRIEIEFMSKEDLSRIFDLLVGKPE